jgi:hypothetical protein
MVTMLYNARKFTECQGSATFGRIVLASVRLRVLPVAKILHECEDDGSDDFGSN